VCRPPPAGRELGPGLSGRMGTQDPPEQTAGQTLHALYLRSEARFQPPPPTFIYFEQKPGSRMGPMVTGSRDGPPCAALLFLPPSDHGL
jgi:hypothetical protein